MITAATKIEINKTRRDHDITMAGTFNDKLLPAKLATSSDRGDGVL